MVKNPFALASTLLFVFVSLSLFTFPGEPHVNRFAGQPLDSVQCERWFHIRDDPTEPGASIYRIFWARWQSFDRLDLPRVDVVDDEKLKTIAANTKAAGERDYQGERTRILRGRDLNCGNFSDFADLRRVDLTNSSLRDASFDRSKLQGASLAEARLQGASLVFAQLQGASLFGAQLQDASLDDAQPQGASLQRAKLQGASLQDAQLQGTSLDRAQLQGTDFKSAWLHGASLARAQLQGASLQFAQFQGASLFSAQLQGTDFTGAWLHGASLDRAQLQGASLGDTELFSTSLNRVLIWRAKDADCGAARVRGHKLDALITFSANNQFRRLRRRLRDS